MNEERSKEKKTLQPWLIVLAALLLLSIIGNIIFMTRSGRLSDEKDNLITEKETLQNEKLILTETIEVKEGVIEERQEYIAELEEEYEAMKNEKDARIAQLNRRLSATSGDLESKKEKNDQLAAEIEELSIRLEETKDELYVLKQETDALASAHEILLGQAEEAAVMNAYNICVLTKWDRWLCADRYNVSRARRTDEMFITFEVSGSVFTEAGTKTVHLLLYDPGEELMYESAGTFTDVATGEEMSFTHMQEIEYANEPVKLDFHIIHPERLQSGPYKVEVYIDGKLSRSKIKMLE